jgi:hypothetical protein
VAGNAAEFAASLQIAPPAYTHLGVQTTNALDAKLPEGSQVAFALRPPTSEGRAAPTRIALAFHDGSRIELHDEAGVWRGARVITAPGLYRVEIDGVIAAADRLHRLDVIPDRPPEIVVRTPDHTLTQLTKGQKTWNLAFEASDDYGLGSSRRRSKLSRSKATATSGIASTKRRWISPLWALPRATISSYL